MKTVNPQDNTVFSDVIVVFIVLQNCGKGNKSAYLTAQSICHYQLLVLSTFVWIGSLNDEREKQINT